MSNSKRVKKEEVIDEVISPPDRQESASKDTFLKFPAHEYTSTILSIGPPKSGKTYLVLECMKEWLEMGMFEEYICIIPNFKNEMSGSYDWMTKHENITIYEGLHTDRLQAIIDEQSKYRELVRNKKMKTMPRIFLFIDDATGLSSKLFKNDVVKKLVTENRHLAIHTWLCLHYAKGVIEPAVRNNMKFLFLYPVSKSLLKTFYQEFIPAQWDEFDEYEDFLKYFKKNVLSKKYGSLLIAGKDGYSADCCDWFGKK